VAPGKMSESGATEGGVVGAAGVRVGVDLDGGVERLGGVGELAGEAGVGVREG
jgi:hypothetical protein